jgi:hypothetical protein
MNQSLKKGAEVSNGNGSNVCSSRFNDGGKFGSPNDASKGGCWGQKVIKIVILSPTEVY